MGNHVSQAQGSQTRSRQAVAKNVGFPPTDAIGPVMWLATAALRPLNVTSYNVLGLEKLWVHGPLSWQTEAMCNFVNRESASSATFYGFYSQIGWFLTGEHRPYDRLAGAIDRVKPFEDFF